MVSLKMSKYILCFVFLLYSTRVLSQELERQLESYYPCSTDTNCQENSFCSQNTLEQQGLCVCSPGYLIQKNRTSYTCLKEAVAIGDPCTEDIQCQYPFGVLGICFHQKCQCENQAHFYKNRCMRTVKLGEPCTFHENCLLKNEKFAYCLSSRCSCDDTSKPHSSASGDECINNVNLGQKCSEDRECKVDNSWCHGYDSCQCKVGYIINSNKTLCLKHALYLHELCEEDVQCSRVPHTECTNSMCACEKGYHAEFKECRKDVELRGACVNQAECGGYGSAADCIEGLCKCLYGETETGKPCINGANDVHNVVYMTLLIVSLALML